MARILVVDDEPDIRELVSINLRIDGHEVTTAVDGDSAIDAAAADAPDLIVLDVMMPGRDGFGVLEVLKADPAGLGRIPVVLLTARTDRIDRIRGGIEGAVVYLTKPFSVVELREAVRDVLASDAGEARRHALTAALSDLARLESGAEASSGPRPRLTRFEPQGPRDAAPPPPAPLDRSLLSARQAEVLDTVAAAPTLIAAARELGVSRSYLYATLSRVAQLLGAANGPDAVRLARAATTAPTDGRPPAAARNP